jgi:ribosome-associated heat shock protein Hsp15
MGVPDAPGLRLDKLLWYLRLAKSRSSANSLVATGHVRIDGKRAEKPHVRVRIGQILTLPIGAHVRVLRLLNIPQRRGPAPEAQACYAEINAMSAESRPQDSIDAAPAAQ